jgi:hypothetical protein
VSRCCFAEGAARGLHCRMSRPSRGTHPRVVARSLLRFANRRCCAARFDYARRQESFNAAREGFHGCCARVTKSSHEIDARNPVTPSAVTQSDARDVRERSHAVALEHPAARPRQLCAVRHQAGLHRTVIAELAPAKALRIARAGPLLLSCSLMSLRDGRLAREAGRQGGCTHQQKAHTHRLILIVLLWAWRRPGVRRETSKKVRKKPESCSSGS